MKAEILITSLEPLQAIKPQSSEYRESMKAVFDKIKKTCPPSE